MKKTFYFLAISVILFSLNNACQTQPAWEPIFNGENLDNFDLYLGTPLRGFDSLANVVTEERVFSVVEEDGENLIRISGEINGALATRNELENYHLQLVFKWGDEVFTSLNSGLLYHSFGDFGEALGTWMTNIECQLMNERMGDTYLMNNTYSETRVEETENGYRYSPSGEVVEFSREHSGSSISKMTDAMNEVGEWNTIDLYCVGRTAVHVVNGQTVMVNHNTGVVENGQVNPLSSGKIQIQSEGGELFIRTFQYLPIDEIPESVMPETE